MDQEIMQAIFNNDIGRLDALFQQGINIKEVTENDRWNLLHRALLSLTMPPAPQIIRKLIDYGVDMNARDRYGNTPLHYAARLKDLELIEMLLNAGAEIDPVNKDGLTPLRLMLTAKPINLAAVELFLSRGANPQQRVEGGITVKEYAKVISHGNAAGLSELFDKYARNPVAGQRLEQRGGEQV